MTSNKQLLRMTVMKEYLKVVFLFFVFLFFVLFYLSFFYKVGSHHSLVPIIIASLITLVVLVIAIMAVYQMVKKGSDK